MRCDLSFVSPFILCREAVDVLPGIYAAKRNAFADVLLAREQYGFDPRPTYGFAVM